MIRCGSLPYHACDDYDGSGIDAETHGNHDMYDHCACDDHDAYAYHGFDEPLLSSQIPGMVAASAVEPGAEDGSATSSLAEASSKHDLVCSSAMR